MARKKKERKLQIPELYLNEAKIEMLGNREIIIDGCKGVIEYDENTIKLNIGDLALCLVGTDMVIESFDSGVAIIRGRFAEIDFIS